MKVRTAVVSVAFAALLAMLPTWAHHTPVGYDINTGVVKGTLESIEWVNPHVQFHLNVRANDGAITKWDIESYPPLWFRKAGIGTANFAKGMGAEVSIHAYLAKDGRPLGFFHGIAFADGTSIMWTFTK